MITNPTPETRARASKCLSMFLRGREEDGHQPLSMKEIASVYTAIVARIMEAEQERERA